MPSLRLVLRNLRRSPAFTLTVIATLAATPVVMLIALCAALIPARRAASIDPMQALRSE